MMQNTWFLLQLERSFQWPLLSMCSSSKSNSFTRKSGTQGLSLSRAGLAFQQAVSCSICGSYALMFACLALCHGSVVFPRGAGNCHFGYHPPPPRVNGPGHVSSFERGGPLARGAVFLLSKGGVHWHAHGGSIDSSSRKKSKKFFVYAFSSLCHWCKRGGDPCLVPLASLWWLWSSRATFCNFFMLLHHFSCGAQHLFPI